MRLGCGKRPDVPLQGRMIFRRFVAAFIIICLGLPSPAFSDTLRVTQEGVQRSGLEEELQGRDEAQLFLDPVIRDGQIVGSPEPFRTYKNFPPTVWGETEVQRAKQLALMGVRSFKVGNGGAAGFSFSGKTYKTALQHSPSLRFLVLVDRESREPTVAFDMATHQQVFPDPDLIDIFLDPKIQDGQIIGSPKVFAQYRNIREGFWSDPTVKRSKVVALSNVGTSRMSGGESAMGEGRASFFLIGRKYPTTLPVNPQLRLLVLVDPQTQLPTAAYDRATHQQVYPVPDLLEVFLDPQIRDGQLVGSPSPFRTYDRIPASFWNLQEVKSARQIAVSHFKTHQVGRALTAQISLAGRPYSITHPYHAQQQLLLVIDPAAKTPTAAFDMKTHEQVYPIPDQISVYLNPEIERGQWKGDPGKPFATRARISAAFLDSSEVKKARSIALMPVPVFENKAGHIAAFSVAGENYNTTLKYDSAIRLLVLVDPETRKPTAAYDITTGQQAYPIPDPIEVFLDPDIQEGRIADPSLPFMTYQKQPRNLWSLKEVKSARRIAFFNVPTYKLTRARKVLFGLAGRKYVLPGATDPSMRLLVVADAQTKLPLSAYDMATGRQVYPALPADEQLRPLADMAAGGDQAWVVGEESQGGLEEGGMDVYLEPVIQGGRVAPDSQAYKTGVRKLTPYFWLEPKVQKATRLAVSGVPARNFEGKVSFSFGSRSYRSKREFRPEEQLRLLVVADRLTQIPQAAYHSLTGEEVWRLPEDQAASALQSLADLAGSEQGWVPELEPSHVPARELEENEVAVYLNPQIKDGHIPEGENPFRIFKRMTPVTFWLIPEVQLAGVVVMDMKVRDHQGSAAFSVGHKIYRTSRRFDPDHRFRMLVVVDSLSREVSAVYDRSTGEKIYPVQDSVEIYLDTPVVKGRLSADARPYVMAQLISDDFWKRREVGEAKTVIVAGLHTTTTYKTAEFFFLGAKYVTNRQFDPDKPLKLLLVVDGPSRKPVVAYDMQTGEEVFPSEDSVKVYLNPQVEGGHLKAGQEPDRRIRAIRGTLWKDPDILQAKAVAFSPVNVVEKKSGDKRKGHVFSWGNSGITIEPRVDGSFSTELLVIADPQMREPTVAYDLETGEVVYRFEDQIRAYRGSDTVPFWVGGRVPADLFKRNLVQGADSVVLENISTFERNGMVYFHTNRRSYATAQPYDREHPVRLRIVIDPETRRPLEAFDMGTGNRIYATERLRAYLDPEIQGGRLQGSPAPFLEIGRPSSDFWSAEAVQKARSVVFENVPAGGTTGETAGFRLIGQGYPTRRKVDKENKLNLLVEADPQTHLPRRAYDQRTGEEVFSSDDLMAVYLAPEISEGRLPAGVSPVMLVSRITPVFWKRPGISEADTIALDHVTTYDKGGFLHFSMAGRTHPTSLSTEGRESLRLLVILDTKSKTVLAAYDRQSGQEVYSSQGMIQVYLDAPISEGKLSGKPVVYRTARVLMPGFWDESVVQGAQRIVLENVRTHADPQQRARFSVAGQPYLTRRRYDSDNPLRLLIDVDRATKRPVAAYDMNSGEAVYPIPAGPADQRLQPLVDMAAGGDAAWVAEDGAGDAQAGLEEMEVYLDPRIKDGRLEPGQSPYWTGNKLNRHFWDQKRVQQSQVVAIANRRTEKAHNSDSAVFSVRSVKYTLDRSFNADRPETLLVVMGLQPNSPVEAYLMDSGEKVYALGAEDLIRIYLDPPMEDGKFVGEPEPFLSGRFVPPSLWRDTKVGAAKEVVVDGVSTFNLSSGKAGFHSGPRGRNNATGREFDSSHPLKLRVVMDRASRLPLWAFDAATGEQVYPAGEQISVYLDPVIEEGRLKSFSRLFFRAEIVRANVWQGLRKITTQPVALQGVPTYQRQTMAAFSIGGKKFETTRIFEQEHPLRLLVIVEPSTLIPSAAYDADTGERVYSSESLIGVHLNSEIRDGKLVDPGKPSHRVAYLSAAFWDRAEVQAASTVALQDVEAISVAGGNSRPRYGFTLRNVKYRTERPFQSDVPLKLLIVANPRTQKPLAAYDQATGEKIYDAQKLVQVHLNPTVEGGRLVSPVSPYVSTGMVQSGLWKDLASKAPVVALSGIRGFHQRGVLTFHIGDVAYRTYFPLEKGSHADLLVIARTADKTPTEAYVLETGQKIYPPSESEISPALQPLADLAKSDAGWVAGEDLDAQAGLEEKIEVYLDPQLADGKLAGLGEPFPVTSKVRPQLLEQAALLSARTLALDGIPTHAVKDGLVFHLFSGMYPLNAVYPPTVTPKLIVVVDVERAVPLYAFDQETRDPVYRQPEGPDVNIAVYRNPVIVDGRLAEGQTSFWKGKVVHVSFWSQPALQQSTTIAFTNIKTEHRGNSAYFRIRSTDYRTERRPDPTLRLLVAVDTKSEIPLKAYDMATGQQVFDLNDKILVYLDPPLEGGKLVGNPPIARVGDQAGASLWTKGGKSLARQVVLANLKPYKQKKKGVAVFSVAGRKYYTQESFDANRRLLVVVDPESQLVLAAYDQASGNRIYTPPKEPTTVYANPTVTNGRVDPANKPFAVVFQMGETLWKALQDEAVTHVGATNVPATDQKGIATFSFGSQRYPTTAAFQAGQSQKFLVLADVASREPTQAFDMSTGQQVFPVPKPVELYLNPVFEGGRLAPGQAAYGAYPRHSSVPWEDPQILSAQQVALTHVPLVRSSREGRHNHFSINRVKYTTSARQETEGTVRVLVVVDPKSQLPSAAYLMTTGEPVYPPPPKPVRVVVRPPKVVETPQVEVELEEEEAPDEAGKVRVEVYLDPVVEGGVVVGDPEPYAVLRRRTGSVWDELWEEEEVQRASQVGLLGMSTRNNHGITAFQFSRRAYQTAHRYDPEHPLNLLIVAEAKTREVTAAYDQETGEQVYPPSGWVTVYLNPAVENGYLAPDAVGWKTIPSITREALEDDAAIRSANQIALANVTTHIRGGEEGNVGFHFLGRNYIVQRRYDSDRPLRLLVVADPKRNPMMPTAAYDMDTGERVYSLEDQIHIYLDPGPIVGGKLPADAVLNGAFYQIPASFWEKSEVRASSRVVLNNHPTFNQNGKSAFHVGSKRYFTDLPHNSEQPVRLLIVADPSLSPIEPIAAFDMASGNQVYSKTDQMQVYANPVLRNGRVAESSDPFWVGGQIPGGFWDRAEIQDAEEVALENVGTHNKNGSTVFSFGRRSYSVGRPFDPLHPLSLLVLVDTRQRPLRVTAAYDMADGSQVYSAGDLMRIYRDPAVQDGRLMGNPSPVAAVKKVQASFWGRTELAGSKTVGISNVRTHNYAGVVLFNLAGQPYQTNLSFQPGRSIRLLVVADPVLRQPVVAYEESTGQQVYPPGQSIGVYPDPVIERGRLASDSKLIPLPYFRNVTASVWEIPEIANAQTAAFSNYFTHPSGNVVSFSLSSASYRTSLSIVPGDPYPTLLLVADPRTRLALAAYDQQTGRQVYPVPMIPVQEPLQSLADMAASPDGWVTGEPPKGGLEEGTGTIKVYLNVGVAEGRIVGNPTPYRETKTRFGAKLLDDPAVAVSNSIVFTGIRERSDAGAAEFSVFGQAYRTNKRVDPAHPVSFLVVMDPRQGLVTEAFNEMTGERVYAWEDQLSIYLDPQMEKGLLVGNPSPFLVTSGVYAAHFRNAQVQKANRVVVDGMSTYNSDGTAIFLRGLRTGKRFDPGHPLRLRVVFDPKTQTPLIAYDMQTGEEVYRLEDEIHAYLEPVIEGGRLKRDSLPYADMSRVTPAFWNQAPVQNAHAVVFANFPASRVDSNGRAVFYLASQRYWTNAVPAKKGPVHLLIVADPKARVPTAVYLQSTGIQVFPADDAMGVYLDPELKDGRVVGDPNPVNYIQIISTRTLGLSSVQRAQNVVFSNVAPHQSGSKAVFSVARIPYVTDLDYDPKTHLLVVVDPVRQIPTAAYEAVSGKQVYPATAALDIYLDAELSGGQLVGTPKPFLSAGIIRSSWWELPEFSAAKQMIVENMPTFSRSGRVTFSLFGEDYPTARVGERSDVERILVVVDLRTRLPVTAYSQVSGERVYPPDDLIRVYVDPEIQKGRLAGTPIPVRILQRGLQSSSWRSPVFQKASQVVFDNVPTSVQSDYVVFGMGGRDYFTRRSHVAGQSLRLLVVVDAATRQPIAAYDTATGEEVYSDEHLIRIFLDPPMEGGRLLSEAAPFLITKAARAKFWSRENVRNASRVVFENVSTTKMAGIGRKAIFYVAGHSYITNRSFNSEQPFRLIVVIDPKNRVPIAAYDKVTGEQVYPVQPVDDQLQPLADMVSQGDQAWVTDEPQQGGPSTEPRTGLEEVAAEVMEGWADGREGHGLMVVSPDVLASIAGPMIRRTVARLPEEVSNRIILPIQSASAEDVAMTVLEQDPLPDRVWVVGSFGPVFAGMLRGFTGVTELTPGSGLEEFLAQVGLMLGVPVEEIESGLEEIRAARPLERAA